MKFLLVSKTADDAGLAYRVQEEGNDVKLYVKDPKAKRLFSGLVPRVEKWEEEYDEDTIIVFGMVGQGKEADILRAAGFKVYGASEIADDLELKRDFGLERAKQFGIEIPESADFTDFEAAASWVKNLDAPCVFKPEHNKDGVKTFVSQSPEQMIRMFDHYKELWKDKIDFVMQEVKEGAEVSSEVWCCNGVIVPNSYNNTWETKRFMNDDYSCMTGCMSSTVKFNACPPLYDETFGKMEDWLKQVKYHGPLDINCIVGYDGTPYMLEWTARMGYSAVYAFCAGLNMDVGEYLATLASGEIPEIEPSNEWLGALRITVPPYPCEEDKPMKETEGLPIDLGDLDEHIWPLDVEMKDGKLCCSGYIGIIAEITDSHPNLSVLWDYIYDRADIIEVPEIQIRTDCYENAIDRINSLSSMGLCDLE
jgi:phosphoribosylamine-glycine ligase